MDNTPQFARNQYKLTSFHLDLHSRLPDLIPRHLFGEERGGVTREVVVGDFVVRTIQPQTGWVQR